MGGSRVSRLPAGEKKGMSGVNGAAVPPPGPVLLMGMPGAGKGTQARRLSSHLAVPHISTGEMFRHLAGDASSLGQRMNGFMQGASYVPDDLVCELVAERLGRPDCQRGFILDGFPRTLAQAEWFEHHVRTAAGEWAGGRSGRGYIVIHLTVGYNDLYRRLSGRRMCPACGRIYNELTQPPRQAGICDLDRSPLIQRKDDAPEVIRERLEAYEAWTLPLVEFFRRHGCLHEVRGSDPADCVSAALDEVLAGVSRMARDNAGSASLDARRDEE
jgi:adenylate kinase